jgi:hypothetical protein
MGVDFDETYQLLIIPSAFIKYFKKWKYNETVHQLCIDFKKAYYSVMREDLCDILFEFGISIKMVWLIKVYLNETISESG